MSSNYRNAVIWLGSAHFICDLYGGFLNPILPFIASKLGFSISIATILIAITQICSNMLQPIFGFFADNILKRFFIFKIIYHKKKVVNVFLQTQIKYISLPFPFLTFI